MDQATRQLFLLRRDMLLAENRRLEREKKEAIEAAVNDPGFGPGRPLTGADHRAGQLIHEQDDLLQQLQEIDRQLKR